MAGCSRDPVWRAVSEFYNKLERFLRRQGSHKRTPGGGSPLVQLSLPARSLRYPHPASDRVVRLPEARSRRGIRVGCKRVGTYPRIPLPHRILLGQRSEEPLTYMGIFRAAALATAPCRRGGAERLRQLVGS